MRGVLDPNILRASERSTRPTFEVSPFKCKIEDHPVVNSVGFLTVSGKNKAGIDTKLRCYASSLDGGCSVTGGDPYVEQTSHNV